MIRKGTTVRIKTTNGGDTTRVLLEDYRPTYGVTVSGNGNFGGWTFVPCWRIVSVEVAS